MESTKNELLLLSLEAKIFKRRAFKELSKSMQFDGGPERSYSFFIFVLKSESRAESGAESEAVFRLEVIFI